MPIARKRNSSPLIAVDFGVAALKAIQVSGGTDDAPLELNACGRVEVPAELHEKPADRISFQAQALSELLSKANMKAKRAVCSVSAGCSIVQHLRIPGGDNAGANVNKLIEEQLEQRLGIFPGGCIVRHQPVGEVHHHGRKWTEMLVSVMPRDRVLSHMNAMRACKLEVVGVHSEHTALAHLFDGFERFAGGDTHNLFLDFGYGSTKVVVARGPETALARTIGIGGLAIDRALARERKCSSAQANRQRRQSFLAAAKAAPVAAGGIMGQLTAEQDEQPESTLNGAARGATSERHDVMDAIGEEIWMCLRHFGAVRESDRVGSAVMVGGEARDKELVSRVARALEIPARVLDPFALLTRSRKVGEFGLSASESQPGMAVALGLCLAPADL